MKKHEKRPVFVMYVKKGGKTNPCIEMQLFVSKCFIVSRRAVDTHDNVAFKHKPQAHHARNA